MNNSARLISELLLLREAIRHTAEIADESGHVAFTSKTLHGIIRRIDMIIEGPDGNSETEKKVH